MRAAAALLVLIAAGAACGGSSTASRTHEAYLWEQSCAPCHALEPGSPSPDVRASNLSSDHLTIEDVRRAVIDGRPGMPKGLLGDGDVDAVAAYVVARTSR
jgi:mono/diheme cytochrome c family protein